MIEVRPVPALRDNYAYLVIDPARRSAAVVDPSEAAPVERALDEAGATLTAIWLTHHHWDHVGGVEDLVAARADRAAPLPVLGSRHDLDEGRIPKQSQGLAEGDRFPFGEAEVQVLEIPGHTLGAIAYLVDGHLFSGDTLFLGGCGRVFEGTMAMMKDSLAKLRGLPSDTRLWCGHEYTVKNLEFAATVEPDSAAVAHALDDARARRAQGAPTVPGTLGQERRINPFFRFDVEPVAAGREPVAAFTALREAKDAF
ncbi:MAG TPA: hydroxyacylglutathione hydrolase [Polyangiaceae bacterium LLY-WYZ-14_1]|nr:hydroxyacylglutathione hydrolase [Polyangiaceae bacterium LLY-WYZ-14_1]